MHILLSIISRDIKIAFRQGGGAGMSAGFFLIVVSILPLGLGPDLNLLSKIAPGILWIGLLLSVQLSLDRLFQADYEDGTLDQLVLSSEPLEFIVFAKVIAHWVTTGLPLCIVAPILGLLLNLDPSAFGALILTMLIGTPALNLTGAIGAGIILGIRGGGLLISILILPFYIPILIFGVSTIEAVIIGSTSFGFSFAVLCLLSLMTLVVGPIAAAAAIRFNLR